MLSLYQTPFSPLTPPPRRWTKVTFRVEAFSLHLTRRTISFDATRNTAAEGDSCWGSNLWPFSRRSPWSNRLNDLTASNPRGLSQVTFSHWNDQRGVTFLSCVGCQATLGFFRFWQVAIYSLQTDTLFSITWIWLLNRSCSDDSKSFYMLYVYDQICCYR